MAALHELRVMRASTSKCEQTVDKKMPKIETSEVQHSQAEKGAAAPLRASGKVVLAKLVIGMRPLRRTPVPRASVKYDTWREKPLSCEPPPAAFVSAASVIERVCHNSTGYLSHSPSASKTS